MHALLETLQDNQWIAVEAVILGFVLRLLKDDTRFPTLPSRWRALAALALGAGVGVLNQKATGVAWAPAILGGLTAGGIAMVGHDTVIGGFRAGKEIPLPKAFRSNLNGSSPEPEIVEVLDDTEG